MIVAELTQLFDEAELNAETIGLILPVVSFQLSANAFMAQCPELSLVESDFLRRWWSTWARCWQLYADAAAAGSGRQWPHACLEDCTRGLIWLRILGHCNGDDAHWRVGT
jgi:hypothetical protein